MKVGLDHVENEWRKSDRNSWHFEILWAKRKAKPIVCSTGDLESKQSRTHTDNIWYCGLLGTGSRRYYFATQRGEWRVASERWAADCMRWEDNVSQIRFVIYELHIAQPNISLLGFRTNNNKLHFTKSNSAKASKLFLPNYALPLACYTSVYMKFWMGQVNEAQDRESVKSRYISRKNCYLAL